MKELLDKLNELNLLEEKGNLLEDCKTSYSVKELAEEDYSMLGNSRIGGNPDFPKTWDYPTINDIPLTFIAQINLSEFKHKDSELPKEGLLYFFLGNDDNAADVANQVLYYNDDFANLHKLEIMNEGEEEDWDEDEEEEEENEDDWRAEADRNFKPVKVNFDKDYSLTWEHFDELYDKHGDKVSSLFKTNTEVLGHTYNGDPGINAYLCKNGLKKLLYEYHKTEQELLKEIERELENGNITKVNYLKTLIEPLKKYAKNKGNAEEWISLFKVESLNESDMCWWDAGILEFQININDLLKRNFSNIYACIHTS